MTPKKAAKRCMIAAISWSVAAGVLAAGILANLPGVAPLPALLFGLCAVCALCWWGAFVRESRIEEKSAEPKAETDEEQENS